MRTDIPKEAVSIDGQYIEDLLPGYMTIKTSGREALTASLESKQVGRSNGSTLVYSRYPERVIEVEFYLEGASLNDLRKKLEHLNNILTAEERDFVFNDEDDRFYTGVPVIENSGTDLKNGFAGKFKINCSYPFKRSNEVHEVTGVKNGTTATFNIQYNGTYPSKPILVAEFAGALSGGDYSDDGDCGYVLFVDSDENIIQLGNPDAIDLDAYASAGQLVNREFTTLSSWSQSGGVAWGNKVIDGSLSVSSISDANWKKGAGLTKSFAKPTYGSNTSGWHGPVLRKTITSSINYDIAITHRMCCKASNELGTFECGAYSVSGSTRKMVTGFVIEKTASGTNGTVRYIVNGKSVGTDSIDLSYYNAHFGYCNKTAVYKTQYYNKKKKKWQDSKVKGAKTRKVTSNYTYTQSNLNSTIKKSDGTVTFKVGNLATRKFTDSDIALTAVSEVSFHFGGYKSNTRLNTNAVNSVKVTSNPAGSFADIPNVFTAGDIVEADCYDASVYLRRKGTEEGQLAPQYGALGNNWEGFELKPGANAISAAWSPWLTNPTYAPTLKILYNEVFI